MALNNQSSAKDVFGDADVAGVRAERVRANVKWREWIVKQSGTTGRCLQQLAALGIDGDPFLTGTLADLRDAVWVVRQIDRLVVSLGTHQRGSHCALHGLRGESG